MSEPRIQLADVLVADRGRLIALTKKRKDFDRQKKPHDQLEQQ